MAEDARIAVGLPSHPKTKKLVKRLGQAAAWNLVCLILWAASNRSDGDLSGMSAEDIELSADWQGEEGAFVAALVAVRFLDGAEGALVLHDWQEHNPWAAGAEMRSAKARWNAAKRHHGAAEADRLVPEYAANRNAASDATSKTPAQTEQAGSNAPSPSPSPSPSPTSDPIGSGGEAAKPAPDLTKDELWKAGKSLLSEAGMPPAQCGSFVGKLVKDYGDQIVVEAVRTAVVSRPADPAQYLKATCMHAAGQRSAAEPAWRAEQRTRTHQAAPGVAAGTAPADQFFINVEATNVAPRRLG